MVPGGLDAAHGAGLAVGHAHGGQGLRHTVVAGEVLPQGLGRGVGALLAGVVVLKLGAVGVGGVGDRAALGVGEFLLQRVGLGGEPLLVEGLDHIGDLLLAVVAGGACAGPVVVDAVGDLQIEVRGLAVLDQIRVGLHKPVHVEEGSGLHDLGEGAGVGG